MSVTIIHYVVMRDLDIFDYAVYYNRTYGVYYMHPRVFPAFEQMMLGAGMELSMFGDNNAQRKWVGR